MNKEQRISNVEINSHCLNEGNLDLEEKMINSELLDSLFLVQYSIFYIKVEYAF
jgi:hypothetical protein